MASLSKIIDVHSHAILNIGQQVPLANQARWSVEGQRSGGDFRRINEALAEIVAKHLKRFGAIATLPGKTIDGSLSKMEYVLDTLKMDGVSTLTSVEDIYLGDSRFDPWFEEMNRRKPVEPARIGRRLRAPGFRTLPPESSEPCS